jgi:hypothetical protein
MIAFPDLRLMARGMAPARLILVIRSVPSEMRGSQGVNGPLAPVLTSCVLRTAGVQHSHPIR